MKIDEQNKNHLIADEGKVLRRISDGWISGVEAHLGYTYSLDSNLLEEPLLELPEHYEEIDEPIIEEDTILSESVSLQEEIEDANVVDDTMKSTNIIDENSMNQARRVVTLVDYELLENEVRELKSIIYQQFKK